MRRVIPVGLVGLCVFLVPARGQGVAPEPFRFADPALQPAQATTPAPVRPGPAPSATRPSPAPPRPAPAAPAATPPAPAPSTPPATPPAANPPTPSPTESAMAAAASPTAGQPGSYGSLAGVSAGGMPQMIGDLPPPPFLRALGTGTTPPGLPAPFPPSKPPGVPGPKVATMVAPSVRGIKVSENQSPFPQDRVYYTFNYFDNVNDAVNRRLQAPIDHTQVFRQIFGVEKTFLDGQGSIGLRIPLDTLSTSSTVPRSFGNFGGSSTALGDLSIVLKYILLQDPQSGSLLSGGVAVSAPTGPGRFAGFANFAGGPHSTTFQPFLGYILSSGNWYLHGFSAIDVPATSNDVTFLYNDIGVGYFLRRDTADSGMNRLISLIAPTFEVHVNDPLNHRQPFNIHDPAATTDIVDLTLGLNIGLCRRTFLTFAVVAPVTSPKPFDLEAMAFVNVFFGRTARNFALAPTVVGGN